MKLITAGSNYDTLMHGKHSYWEAAWSILVKPRNSVMTKDTQSLDWVTCYTTPQWYNGSNLAETRSDTVFNMSFWYFKNESAGQWHAQHSCMLSWKVTGVSQDNMCLIASVHRMSSSGYANVGVYVCTCFWQHFGGQTKCTKSRSSHGLHSNRDISLTNKQ